MGGIYDNLKQYFAKVGLEYLDSLHWMYIISLMILVYALNKWAHPETEFHIWKLSFTINAAYRVLIFGFLLSMFYYWLDDGQGREYMKMMFQSMLAAFAVYAAVFKYVVKFIDWGLKRTFDAKTK